MSMLLTDDNDRPIPELLVGVALGWGGIESLRYALLIIVLGFAAWSVVHYTLAARTLAADLLAKEA